MGFTEASVFVLGVLMGTGSTLTIKIIYGLEAIGISGEMQRFEKPLTTTWVMFLAMSLALPAHWISTFIQNRRNDKNRLAYGKAVEPVQVVPWRTYFLLVIPSCFDLLGTALSGVGLLFTTVSVYQLMRCSVIIVTAILKSTVLKHKLSPYMWFGLFINTVAMLLVSSTSLAPETSTASSAAVARDPRIGIFFILLSCIVQGSQYIFEEKVMTVDSAPPLVVVGMEGVWGMILMPLIVFPWAYILPGTDVGGCIENIFDAWVMLCNSRSIQIVLALFTLTVFFYNIFCIYVTFLLSSIWHAILDNFRPVSVWGTDLALFYLFTHGRFGEEWNRYSWLELGGMLLLFFGTAVYNGTIEIPGFEYPDEQQVESMTDMMGHPQNIPGTPKTRTPYSELANNLCRSPLINAAIARSRSMSGSSSEFAGVSVSNYGTMGYEKVPTSSSRRNVHSSSGAFETQNGGH